MKKLLFLLVLCVGGGFVSAAECPAEQDTLLSALSAQLRRNFKTLKKLRPPVYYMSYQLYETSAFQANAKAGALEFSITDDSGAVDISARVGSVHTDNTHELKGTYTNTDLISVQVPLARRNSLALRNALWRGTQAAVENAQQEYNRVLSNKQVSAENMDTSDDFALPQKNIFCQEEKTFEYNRAEIEERLKRLSLQGEKYDFVDDAAFAFRLERINTYFVDSVGNRIFTSRAFGRYILSVQARNPDGMDLERNMIYDGVKAEDFPTEETMAADLERMAQELKALKNAPVVEPFTGPVILKNRASGVFFHEILGHRLEGHRQKSDTFGQTFTKKVGAQIVSPILSVSDNPRWEEFNGIPLRGFYLFDDEGNPAENVPLIEKGILKNFLMSASPIQNFSKSNGHGRKSAGYRVVARMGNTVITPQESMPYAQLEQKLLEEIKRQGKPYGLIIEDISGGFTMTDTSAPQSFKVNPLLVYRVYPDGRKEVVRGVDLVGTPLASFSKVIAAGDDYAVFNGSCGAESGWVPVSAVSPSILVAEMEVEKVAKSPSKPPILRPPYTENHKGKK